MNTVGYVCKYKISKSKYKQNLSENKNCTTFLSEWNHCSALSAPLHPPSLVAPRHPFVGSETNVSVLSAQLID